MKQLLINAAIAVAVLLSVTISEVAIAQDAYHCAGITAKSKPCMMLVAKQGDYCRYHSPNRVHCAGITSKGKPCMMTVAKAGEYCRYHKK